MEEKLKKDLTLKAFESWLEIGGGINPNPEDVERFYKFACEYCNNGENLSKKTFVKMCKKYTRTTRNINRGVCQKYYDRLNTICDFIKWYNTNN